MPDTPMATTPDRETVDRFIDDHFDTHPNDRYAYHSDPVFHAGVNIAREFLYATYAGCRATGLKYDQARDLIVHLITTMVDSESYAEASQRRAMVQRLYSSQSSVLASVAAFQRGH